MMHSTIHVDPSKAQSKLIWNRLIWIAFRVNSFDSDWRPTVWFSLLDYVVQDGHRLRRWRHRCDIFIRGCLDHVPVATYTFLIHMIWLTASRITWAFLQILQLLYVKKWSVLHVFFQRTRKFHRPSPPRGYSLTEMREEHPTKSKIKNQKSKIKNQKKNKS